MCFAYAKFKVTLFSIMRDTLRYIWEKKIEKDAKLIYTPFCHTLLDMADIPRAPSEHHEAILDQISDQSVM